MFISGNLAGSFVLQRCFSFLVVLLSGWASQTTLFIRGIAAVPSRVSANNSRFFPYKKSPNCGKLLQSISLQPDHLSKRLKTKSYSRYLSLFRIVTLDFGFEAEIGVPAKGVLTWPLSGGSAYPGVGYAYCTLFLSPVSAKNCLRVRPGPGFL